MVEDHETSANVLNYNMEQIVLSWANQWTANFNPTKTKTKTVSFKRTIGTVLRNHPLLFRMYH